SSGLQNLRGDFGAVCKRIQLIEVNHRHLNFKRIAKAALWHPALKWHLAACKTRLGIAAGPRALAFVTAARGFPVPGAVAAADALTFFVRARGGSQITQIHAIEFLPGTFRGGRQSLAERANRAKPRTLL